MTGSSHDPSSQSASWKQTASRRQALEGPSYALILWSMLALLFLGASATFVVLDHTKIARPAEGDAVFYIAIAKSLALGNGYIDTSSFWPTVPTTSRAPGWPFLLTIPFALFPSADPVVVARIFCGALHVLSSILLFFLSFRLSRRVIVSFFAGLFWALNPNALFLASTGLSEVAFLVVVITGLLCLLSGKKAQLLGWLLLGYGVLIRQNFLLFPLMAVVALPFIYKRDTLKKLPFFFLGTMLFFLPPLLWMGRNYQVTGKFPLMSSLRGETLWGANNPRTAQDLQVWGYWIFPDEIPNETPKHVLAEQMSEIQVDEYYSKKANEFLRTEWRQLPRLTLGKFIRGYIPVPWVFSTPSALAFAQRAVLYLLFLVTIPWWRKKLLPEYSWLVLGMFFVSVATTAIFYGCGRFTLCIEPFLLPYCVVGIHWIKEGILAKRRERIPSASSQEEQL